MSVVPHLQAGIDAERIGRDYLEKRGLSTIATNYRCRRGELDLVMTLHDTLVFVEIRYRRSTTPVPPEQTITPAKQRRVALAAQHFLSCHGSFRHYPARFDVLAMSGNLPAPDIRWIPNAFTMDDLSPFIRRL